MWFHSQCQSWKEKSGSQNQQYLVFMLKIMGGSEVNNISANNGKEQHGKNIWHVRMTGELLTWDLFVVILDCQILLEWEMISAYILDNMGTIFLCTKAEHEFINTLFLFSFFSKNCAGLSTYAYNRTCFYLNLENYRQSSLCTLCGLAQQSFPLVETQTHETPNERNTTWKQYALTIPLQQWQLRQTKSCSGGCSDKQTEDWQPKNSTQIRSNHK